ncbi:MAG: FliG C-terminal domain-containing protein [Elusimicrobiales bacterium]|nr:FliG C-terminal domain-containing protein [Elusimicrobiales bacterium]
MKLISRLITLSILCLALGAQAQDVPVGSPSAQAAEISTRMQEDVSRLLEQLVGRGRARSFVSVEGEIVLKGKSESGAPAEDTLTLPGYASVNILEKTGQYLKQQREESQRTSEFRVKKLSVSLVFDRSVPETRVNAIKLMVSAVLRLSEARGDSIIAERSEMLPWWKSTLEAPEIRPVLIASAFGALALAVLLIFGYILASKLLSGFVDYARINAPSSTNVTTTGGGAMGPGGEGTEEDEFGNVIDVESRAASGSAMLTAGSAFEFMEKLPPEEAADLLSDMPEEDAAIIIANMADRKPHISSKILLALAPAKKQAVSAQLLGLKQADPEKVYEIENDLRLKLEKSLKGAEKLGRLLSLVNEAERTEIMDNLTRTNPKGSEELRRKMVTFDDLCRLDEKNLRPLVVSLPYVDWAAALSAAGETAVGNVTRLLPEDIRIIVKDMMLNKPEEEKIMIARAKIISAAIELNSKGRIVIKEAA